MFKDRKLGYIETLCQLGHDEVHGMGNISVLAKIRGPLSIDILRDASKYLYEHHPLLKASIFFDKEKDNYYFRFQNSFDDIPVEMIDLNENAVNQIYESELDKLFDIAHYLWRILLLNDKKQSNTHYIILSMHHSIADGISSAYFIDELLGYCHSVFHKEKLLINPLPIYESLEEISPDAPSWIDYLKGSQANEWGSIKKTSFEKYTTSMPYHQHQPLGKRQTHCLSFTLNKDLMERVKSKCKQEGTSVNAALGASLLLSAQKQFQEPIKLMLYTAISLREKCLPKIPVNELGCYASVIKEEYFNIDIHMNFWDLARQYRSDLQRELNKRTDLFPKGTTLSEIRQTFNTDTISQSKEFNLNYMLTNLGKMDFARSRKPFELENIRFVGSRQGGDQVMVVAVLTVNDRMFLNFAYTHPLLSAEWAESFSKNFMDDLSRALDD